MKYTVKRVSALMALLLAISLFAFADATAEGIAVTGAEERLTTGTYSASGNKTWAHRVTITGNVTLILEGGANLTAAQGIEVLSGNSLTIDGTGTLTANSAPNNAAIGGSAGKDAGDITINGGTVTATCSGMETYCAGIGGAKGSKFGSITITGGTVEGSRIQKGKYVGQGIGAGEDGSVGKVTLSPEATVTNNQTRSIAFSARRSSMAP